jgi:predicted Ser/Thr protein kinase
VLSPGDLVLDERFRLLRPLARGGMGEVFLAEQISLGRTVALKVLRRDLREQPGMNERFQREATLLAQVDHPAVVGIIEYGLHEGASVLVMEYVEGRTLEAALEKGDLTPQQAYRILMQVVDGLSAIHAAGIVHRDLKPENVLLSPALRGERARLLDFGIARLADAAADSALSQIGVVLGTPEYLSPEQAAGIRVDARSDLYSFGLIAYRCLTGSLPFQGDSPRSWLSLHLTAIPRPLHHKRAELATLTRLNALILACLEKEPDRRPESATKVLETLMDRRLRDELDAAFAPDGTPRRRPTPTGMHVPSEELRALGRRHGSPDGSEAIPPRIPESVLARRRWGGVALVAVLMLVVLSALVVRSQNLAQRASALIAVGAPDTALAMLDAAETAAREADAGTEPPSEEGVEGQAPPKVAPGSIELRMIRAEALHALGRHREEHAVLQELPAESWTTGRDRTLTAMASDFALDEENPALRQVLSLWPAERLRATFSEWAQEPASERSYGLLRFLDRADRVSERALATAYAKFVDEGSCDQRRVAARRLGELGPHPHGEVLKKLAEHAERGCGREEARQSLTRLEGTP